MKLTNAELDMILDDAGLMINQPYNPNQRYRKDEYLFTRCQCCGTEAHYQLRYILEKRQATCRACYWLGWYGKAHELYDSGVKQLIVMGATPRELTERGVIQQAKDATWDEAAALAQEHGYELVSLMHGARLGDDVLVVRCPACGRQVIKRPFDVKFSCGCIKSKSKGTGVAFGAEAVKVTVPLEDRNIAPRTPAAQGLSRWIERSNSDDYRQLRGRVCADFPELMAAWEDPANPFTLPVDTAYRRHLRCEKSHHPYQTPSSFLINGCMVCRGLATKASSNKQYLAETNPELAAEWDAALDGPKYTPQNVGSGSRRKVQWKCIACGQTWVDTVHNRELRMNNRCPHCGKVMGSLAWKHPEVARIWSPNNLLSPWNIKPHSALDFKPEWVCLNDPSHVWKEGVAAAIRKHGTCRFCG